MGEADESETEPSPDAPDRSITRMVGGDTLGQFLGRVVAGGASLVALRLATVALGPTRYGHVAIALALVQVFGGIADFGLLAVVTRDMAVADAESAADILRSAFWLRLALGAVSTVAVLAITAVAFGHEPGVLTGVLILAPILITRAVDLAYTAWFAAATRLATPTLIVAVVQLVSLPFLWLLLRNNGGGAAYLGITAAAAVVSGLAIAAWSRRPLRGRTSTGTARGRELLRAALPLGVVTVVNMVYLRLDGVLLAIERPAAQVAYYGVAYRPIDFVVGLPALLMLALLPSLAQATPARQLELVQRALDVLVLAAVVICLGVAASAHLIVGVLGGSDFYPASRPLAILGIGAAISFGSGVFGHALVAIHEQRRMLHIVLAVTIVNLTANLAFIHYWGPTGASLALVLSELVGLILLERAFRRASAAGPSWRELWRLAPATVAGVALWLVVRATVARSDSFVATAAPIAAVGAVFVGLAAATGALRPLGVGGPSRSASG